MHILVIILFFKGLNTIRDHSINIIKIQFLSLLNVYFEILTKCLKILITHLENNKENIYVVYVINPVKKWKRKKKF